MGFWKSKPPSGVRLRLGDSLGLPLTSPLVSSLVFYAALNEGSGDAFDLVAGVRGVRSGMVWGGGQPGTVLVGTGAGNVDFGDPPSLTFFSRDLAMYCLFRTTDSGVRRPVFQKFSGGGFGFLMDVLESGRFRAAFGSNVGVTILDSANVVNDGKWHSVLVTRSGANARMWVDGALSASATDGPQNLFSNSIHFQIGASSYASDFVGQIGQVAVFNRALTVEDAVRLASDPFCMFADPLWRRSVGAYGSAGGSPIWNGRLTPTRLRLGI